MAKPPVRIKNKCNERYLVSLLTHEHEAPEGLWFAEFVVLQPYDLGGPLAWG